MKLKFLLTLVGLKLGQGVASASSAAASSTGWEDTNFALAMLQIREDVVNTVADGNMFSMLLHPLPQHGPIRNLDQQADCLLANPQGSFEAGLEATSSMALQLEIALARCRDEQPPSVKTAAQKIEGLLQAVSTHTLTAPAQNLTSCASLRGALVKPTTAAEFELPRLNLASLILNFSGSGYAASNFLLTGLRKHSGTCAHTIAPTLTEASSLPPFVLDDSYTVPWIANWNDLLHRELHAFERREIEKALPLSHEQQHRISSVVRRHANISINETLASSELIDSVSRPLQLCALNARALSHAVEIRSAILAWTVVQDLLLTPTGLRHVLTFSRERLQPAGLYEQLRTQIVANSAQLFAWLESVFSVAAYANLPYVAPLVSLTPFAAMYGDPDTNVPVTLPQLARIFLVELSSLTANLEIAQH
ncbi:MAG: hypothetical protein MHM6MM_005540 [Cercozoa sp. M6MM]